ncbi:acyloxyacyl hydrolase [Labilibacter sediminis]|nr:acyloxyacyl hydrolase [Labilibacter sediminis]
MRITHLLLISSFLLLLLPATIAQTNDIASEKTPKFIKYLDVRLENGAMLSNGSDLGDQIVNSSYYNGLDLRLGFRKSDPKDVYSNVYRKPYIGIGWYSSTFHNENIGSPNALYFFITAPFKYQPDKKLTFSYSGAFGLSYNFNPHDSEDNPANVFIGSYRNCYVHLALTMDYKLSDRFEANASLGFKHFSNGAFKLPNSGINLIPMTVALRYRLNKEEVPDEQVILDPYKQHNLINVTYSAGSKNYDAGERNYLKSTLGVNYLKQINYKYRVGLGVDIFHAAGALDRNDSDKSNFSKSVSLAVVGSWEWAITQKLYAPIGVGVYVHRNKENGEREVYYERVGLRYRFADHLCAGLTIKAHAGVADMFEWTIGYTFHNDRNFK